MSDAASNEPEVLVVDDDPSIRKALERALRLEGFSVRLAGGGYDALATMRSFPPDVVVLDVTMPDLDGVSVTRRLRQQGVDVPICILSSQSSVEDRVAGLQAGADDYLVKPFAIPELVARLHALLRPAAPLGNSDHMLSIADLKLDTKRRSVTRGRRPIELTRREFDLLEVLVHNAGIVLDRRRLMSLVWGYDFDVDTNVVDVFVSYLRRKLEEAGEPRLIHTVRGVGFVARESE